MGNCRGPRHYRLSKVKEEEELYLTGEDAELPSDIKITDGKAIEDEKARLSELIQDINDIFGDFDFSEGDKLFFDQIAEDLSVSSTIKAQAENNTRENFKYGVNDAVMDAVISRMSKNEKVAQAFLDNEDFRDLIIDKVILPKIYESLSGERPPV